MAALSGCVKFWWRGLHIRSGEEVARWLHRHAVDMAAQKGCIRRLSTGLHKKPHEKAVKTAAQKGCIKRLH